MAGVIRHKRARRVRQILTNLIANAIKATAQGAVSVHVEARPPYVALIVRDTGAGISPEDAAAIFQPYRQGGDQRSRRGGAGLGLSIAQRLVGMHGGTIAVESRLGEGSIFTVCLPAVDEDAPELISRPDYGRPDFISRPDLVSWPDFTPRPDRVSNPDIVMPSDRPPPFPKGRA